jgi:lycopene beta-cyclase
MALAKRRPDVDILLIEQGEVFGGNHTWSFFDTDVADSNRWVLDGIAAHRWPEHEVRFPKRRRTIGIGYFSIRSEALDAAVRKALRPDQLLLGRRIDAVSPTAVTLEGGEEIRGDAVIDARGPEAMPELVLGWQKFVGLTYRFDRPHGVTKPVIMDGTVEQIDGYRFIYQLPISATELLIEDTYYSASPVLDEDALHQRIEAVADGLGAGRNVIAEERGVLPVVMSGDVASLWSGEPVARIGLRGGYFHPTTSYSLPDAVANAALLAEQRDFTAPALHALFRERSEQLWQQRSFFRLLNRMLFRAAEPNEAYRVLEHFYRLPPAIIARFYSARLTPFDKLRVLTGRPPVPIGRALSAMRASAA